MTWIILIAFISAIAFFAPSLVGTGLITIGSTLSGFSSKFLDLAMWGLVVKFDSIIYSLAGPAIGTVWEVFRDISNIVIIGMFVFIALSMILGIQNFNAKKMVARVLLVAVLINFSLMFTRVIISSSNFIAGQFYCAMALNSGQTSACGSGTANISDFLSSSVSDSGIGGQFMYYLGLPSLLSAYGTVEAVFNQNSGGSYFSAQGALMAVLYGTTTAVLMVFAALVFAYASFLLVARTVLFLFLLGTSALAFSAYLIPKWGNQYWNMWWQSLLTNAVFGPMLMVMLWATFTVANALVTGLGGSRSFDALFSQPTAGSGYVALLVFAIILGMLYASIRFASKFATRVGGFDWASMAPAFALGQLGRFGGLAGRNSIGWGSTLAADRLDASKRAAFDDKRLFKGRMLELAAQGFRVPASKDFNAANMFGKQLSRISGLNGKFAGGTNLGGYEGGRDRRDREMYKLQKDRVLTDQEAKEKLDKNRESLRSNAALESKLAEDHEKTRQDIRSLESQVVNRGDHKEAIQKEIAKLDDERKRLSANPDAPGAAGRISEIDRLKAEHSGELQHQESRITEAQKRLEDFVTRSQDIRNKREELQKRMDAAAANIARLDQPFGARVAQATTEARARHPENAIPQALGISGSDSKMLAERMDKLIDAVRKQEGIESIAKTVHEMQTKNKEVAKADQFDRNKTIHLLEDLRSQNQTVNIKSDSKETQ